MHYLKGALDAGVTLVAGTNQPWERSKSRNLNLKTCSVRLPDAYVLHPEAPSTEAIIPSRSRRVSRDERSSPLNAADGSSADASEVLAENTRAAVSSGSKHTDESGTSKGTCSSTASAIIDNSRTDDKVEPARVARGSDDDDSQSTCNRRAIIAADTSSILRDDPSLPSASWSGTESTEEEAKRLSLEKVFTWQQQRFVHNVPHHDSSRFADDAVVDTALSHMSSKSSAGVLQGDHTGFQGMSPSLSQRRYLRQQLALQQQVSPFIDHDHGYSSSSFEGCFQTPLTHPNDCIGTSRSTSNPSNLIALMTRSFKADDRDCDAVRKTSSSPYRHEAEEQVYQTFISCGQLEASSHFDGHEYSILGGSFMTLLVNTTGKAVDYKALHYSKLAEFMRSIPWVRVRRYPAGHCEFLCVAFDRAMEPDSIMDALRAYAKTKVE